MADIAFAETLGRLGFNAWARELLSQQGFTTLTDLCNIAIGEIDPLMKHLAS
jgi:Holliday junction resolvase-like predicted endonuclease